MSMWDIILPVWAYVLGSIPSAVWNGKIFYNIDVRNYGSGNAGATNTLRVLGKKAALAVLFVDVIKGLFAARLAYLHPDLITGSSEFMLHMILYGSLAVAGHIFPVFAGFKGGKGIATLLGIMITIHPNVVLIGVVIFIITVLITRYVSLGSILASFSFPVYVILIEHAQNKPLSVFSLIVPIVVLITHQKNIQRLLDGSENKIFSHSNEEVEDEEMIVTS